MKEGNYPLAESIFLRSISIDESTFGPEHPRLATNLGNLGRLYVRNNQFERAELVQKRALSIREKSLGFDHPDIAVSLNNLADLYSSQGKHAEAEELFKRSLNILEKAHEPDHPSLAMIFDNLAGNYAVQNRYDEALDAVRKSTLISARGIETTSGASTSLISSNIYRKDKSYEGHAITAAKVLQSTTDRPSLIAEAFIAAQYARMVTTGAALTEMAVRAAANNFELREKVREYQDSLSAWRLSDKKIIEAISLPDNQRSPAIDQLLRQQVKDAKVKVNRLNAEIQRGFPQYFELISPEPLSVTDAQKMLDPEEALISYLVTENAILVWVIRPKIAELIRLELGRDALNQQIQTLRQGVNLTNGIPAFPHQVAHQIYELIFAPMVQMLAGVKHIMVVADGPLQSMPFGILLSAEVPSAQEKNVPWLIRDFSFTNLPAVTSLRALRQFPIKKPAVEPFVGFGDPLLKGPPGGARGVSLSRLFSRGSVVGLNEFDNLERLPETADELLAISGILKSKKENVYLGEAATERRVKSMDLTPYKVIAFSTHGLLVGEFKGLAEPSLVLTPPNLPTDLDDGLLTASEVVGLKLNADLVILSACNTASPDGTTGAEGFSGLTKAFLYAGSRSLLVSHWAVDSLATVALITRFLTETEKGSSRADALRTSMLALIDHPTDPILRHPALWAPFVVVGEGAVGWR